MKINNATMLRITRAEKLKGEYGREELFCVAPFKQLARLLRLRHDDAARRVKAELEAGEPVSFLHNTIGGHGETERFAIQVLKDDE